MYRNVFGLIVDIDDYEAGTYLQTKHATYRETQLWVKERYGLHVSNHAISQVKALCGLARDGPGGAEGQDGPKLRSDKEAAIREAFLWFGIIKSVVVHLPPGHAAGAATLIFQGKRPRNQPGRQGQGHQGG